MEWSGRGSVEDPVPVAAREAGEGAAQRPDGAHCGRNGGNDGDSGSGERTDGADDGDGVTYEQ